MQFLHSEKHINFLSFWDYIMWNRLNVKKKVINSYSRRCLSISWSQSIGNFQILNEIFSNFGKIGWFGTFLGCGCKEVFEFLNFTNQCHFHLKHGFVEIKELRGSSSLFNHHFLQVRALLIFQCFANAIRYLNGEWWKEEEKKIKLTFHCISTENSAVNSTEV